MKVSEQTVTQFSNRTDYVVNLLDDTSNIYKYSITTPDGEVRNVRPSPRPLSDKEVRQLYHKVLVAGKYNSGIEINKEVLKDYDSLYSQEEVVLEHLNHFIENQFSESVTLVYGKFSYHLTYENLFRKKLTSLYSSLIDSPVRPYITTSKSLYAGKPSRSFIVALNRYKRLVERRYELSGYGESAS